MLVINDDHFSARAEIIWEKGTNRAQFFRGEVNKYGWVNIGSSFLPSEIIAAFLYAQLLNLEIIQQTRKKIWQKYYESLKILDEKGFIRLPHIPNYATNNAHMFYIICNGNDVQQKLLAFMKQNGILATFHNLSLHKSPYYENKHDGRDLPMADFYSDHLVRLPLFYELSEQEQEEVITKIFEFFGYNK